MSTVFHSLRAKSFVLLALVSVFILAACGGTTTSSSGTTPTTSTSGITPPANITLTVGGKLDTEAQLLTKMYTLLLRKAGYNVVEKAALGNTTIVTQAIKSGAIDLYPEFTATGLDILKLTTSHDPQKDYQTVKAGYEQQFQITWLDVAPLNDTYAICTTKEELSKLSVTNISDLAAKVSQLNMAVPSDSTYVLDGLKAVYGFDSTSFKSLQKIDYALGFTAVTSGQAQLNFCYTTDATVTQKGFVFIPDDKNGFPIYNPAPIVRQDTLAKAPGIKNALNPLASKLTTQVSIDLQTKVATIKASGASVSQAITQVATDFLKSQGLL